MAVYALGLALWEKIVLGLALWDQDSWQYVLGLALWDQDSWQYILGLEWWAQDSWQYVWAYIVSRQIFLTVSFGPSIVGPSTLVSMFWASHYGPKCFIDSTFWA